MLSHTTECGDIDNKLNNYGNLVREGVILYKFHGKHSQNSQSSVSIV